MKAAGLLDDPVDHRKAQPGALTHPLGGEEGLEDLLQVFGGDSRPAVDHPDHRIVARRHQRPVAAQGFDQGDRLGLDHDAAARRHRVPGVDHQVDQHLLQLPSVARRMKPSFRPLAAPDAPASAPTRSTTSRFRRWVRSDSTSSRSTRSGFRVCLREKARSCPTSAAARLAFCRICSRSAKSGRFAARAAEAVGRNARKWPSEGC